MHERGGQRVGDGQVSERGEPCREYEDEPVRALHAYDEVAHRAYDALQSGDDRQQ